MTDKTPSTAPDAEAARPEPDAPEPDAPEPDAPADRAETGAAAAPADGGAPAGRPVVEVSPGVYKRLTTGLGGFTMAMGACLLIVLAVYVITPRSDKEVLPTVDYAPQLWAMRSDAPFTVYAPEGLPLHWRPNSSRVHGLDSGGKDPVAWHLGFVTPSEEYAALEQSNEKASQYVPRMANSSQPVGTQQVNGVSWTKYYRKDKKANTLARTLPNGVSLVVTGTASYAELAVLAGSLKEQAKTGGPTPPVTVTPAS
ncbi:DUF4245 domain-containing protein [Actinomadura sp. WMMA1423]|uniref:DUF4245 domain-containing protein n=1 Tax=Actinomadura sp. WMMA1423 TaxID=2591108 RepID=UPI0011465489|nr:DUF4245 domain-containing protein [Actinomadura sp. WMMA1423]